MAKYEILTIVDGSLTEADASKALNHALKTINKNKDFTTKSLGLKDLAYPISGCTKGWYTQFNFSSTVPSEISEFGRLAKLERKIIRFLIINLDKDYGANALANPKKVKKAHRQQLIYKRKMERLAAEKEKKAEIDSAIKQVNDEVKLEQTK